MVNLIASGDSFGDKPNSSRDETFMDDINFVFLIHKTLQSLGQPTIAIYVTFHFHEAEISLLKIF